MHVDLEYADWLYILLVLQQNYTQENGYYQPIQLIPRKNCCSDNKYSYSQLLIILCLCKLRSWLCVHTHLCIYVI